VARALGKCEYCRAIGYHCKERRCGIEYVKYIIVLQALIDFVSQPIDIKFTVDANLSTAKSAVTKLKLMKRSGSLLRFIVDRVIPYADGLVDKSEYCNAVGAVDCDVEYTMYVIMYHAITDFINQPIDIRIYINGAVDSGVIRVASRELKNLKRMGGLLRFIRDRVAPFILVPRG
jgi:hypothetical protein